MALKCVIRYICAMNTAVTHNIVLLFIWIYFPTILIGYINLYNEVYGTWRLILLIVVSQKPCILINRGILFTNYRKNLYTNCTLFNRLIIVSGYNKIVHFLIKNELQSPYIKDSVMKPQLILQVTPLPADNRTWYTPPTLIIGHVAEAHLIRCYCVHVIVKVKSTCDNQFISLSQQTNTVQSQLFRLYLPNTYHITS